MSDILAKCDPALNERYNLCNLCVILETSDILDNNDEEEEKEVK